MAVSVCEYATPTVPLGSEVVVIASGGRFTVMEKSPVAD